MKVIISGILVSRNILQKVNSYLGDNEEIGAKQGVQKPINTKEELTRTSVRVLLQKND